MRVAVLDDHPLLRAGVVHTLAAEPDIKVVGEGSSAEDALYLAEKSNPDVMLLAVNMPGGGVEVMGRVLALCPDMKLVLLSGVLEHNQVRSAMQMGAWGFVLDKISGAELAPSVRLIHRGEHYVTPALAARLFAALPAVPAEVHSARLAGLTCREEQVLAHLGRGLSNKEIGSKLKLSEKTVKRHVTTLLDKLGVRSRVQAVILVHERSNTRPGHLLSSTGYRQNK